VVDYQDKAGQKHWDQTWSERDLQAPVNPGDLSLDNHMNRRLDRFLSRYLVDQRKIAPQARGRVLEVGCAASSWLPYFAKQFGYQVDGIDYSALGCKHARAALRKADVDGYVHHADMFDPQDSLLGRYDVVFSLGLLEHFSPTSRALGQLVKFVRPKGKIITIIPNMTHVVGWLQKAVDRTVYDIHVPIDVTDLAVAHEVCGVRLLESCYLGTVNWAVVNYAGQTDRWWQPVAVRLASWASKWVWLAESSGVPEVPNRWTSPYIGAVAEVI
jgi:2-polyprenyl-3-methyl-5-hydroxy-6-metoxy-1,4-benzoquinol methylase